MSIEFEFDMGEVVYDSLTLKDVKIIGIEFKNGRRFNEKTKAFGTIAYWVDNPYLEGGRHPWELVKIERKKQCQKS